MSNFINLEPLYVNLAYKFHPFILCSEEGEVSAFRFHPLLTLQTLPPCRNNENVSQQNSLPSFYVLKKGKYRFFDFTFY